MKRLGIIGGTTLNKLSADIKTRQENVTTPFGEPSSPFSRFDLNGIELIFLSRHGTGHSVPPHLINYRANIWALHELGVDGIIAFATVGGIAATLPPGSLVVPDQIIDYTHGRLDTFYDRDFSIDRHIEFAFPYDPVLREQLLIAAAQAGLAVKAGGTYGVTQGPRLESAAEIRRMAQDGCDLVGMTGMPEAALARELGLAYASCAIVVNWAAGLSEQAISILEIRAIANDANIRLWHWLEALSALVFATE